VFIAYLAPTFALGLLVYLLRRSRLGNVTLLLFSLALCVTSLEAYYRFIYAESDGFGQLSKNFAARHYRFDGYGLRASNLPLAETKNNVVVVGDSHVFGAGLKSTADRFSEKVAAHYPDLHVVNLGLPGWDTKTETARVAKYLGESRDPIPLVVLTYFFNDIEEDVSATDRERLIPAARAPKPSMIDHVLQSLSKQSRFVELFYYRVGYPRLVRDRLDQIQMFYGDPEIMARHMATLEEFRSVVEKKYGARVLMVVLPYLHSEELLHKDAFYERFRNALGERGFYYIDMQPTFATYKTKKLWVSRFDPHTNAFANDLIAEAIIRFLNAHPENLGEKQRPVSP
jgi:hypothetical protein